MPREFRRAIDDMLAAIHGVEQDKRSMNELPKLKMALQAVMEQFPER